MKKKKPNGNKIKEKTPLLHRTKQRSRSTAGEKPRMQRRIKRGRFSSLLSSDDTIQACAAGAGHHALVEYSRIERHKSIPLLDRYTVHAGQHLETKTDSIVDDTLEMEVYEDLLSVARETVVVDETVGKCRVEASKASARVEGRKQQLREARIAEEYWQTRLANSQENPYYIHSGTTTRCSSTSPRIA